MIAHPTLGAASNPSPTPPVCECYDRRRTHQPGHRQSVFRGHREIQRRHRSTGAGDQPVENGYRYIREIRPRRFLLVDEERGVVYTMVMFQHPGNVTGLPMWDTQYKDPTSIINYPNSMAMTEAFRIRAGGSRTSSHRW
jgi:hypothetical protein